jgi:hypothetical protein
MANPIHPDPAWLAWHLDNLRKGRTIYGTGPGSQGPGSNTAAAQPASPSQISADMGMVVELSEIDGITEKGIINPPFVFQVPPLDEFGYEVTYTHQEFETIKRRQYSRPESEQLMTMSFSTLFMEWDAPWHIRRPDRGEFEWAAAHPQGMEVIPGAGPGRVKLDPLKEVATLRKLMSSSTAFWLKASTPGQPTVRERMTLRSVKVTEKAGEVDALYVDLAFTEWRPIGKVDIFQRPKLETVRGAILRPGQKKKEIADNAMSLNEFVRRHYGSRNIADARAAVRNANGIPSSVEPNDEKDLIKWMRDNDRTALIVPFVQNTNRDPETVGGSIRQEVT